MTNWAVASAISGAHRVADPVDTPGGALPAGVVSVTVRSLHWSARLPAQAVPPARRLITLVLRASRPQPVMSVLRSLSPCGPRARYTPGGFAPDSRGVPPWPWRLRGARARIGAGPRAR